MPNMTRERLFDMKGAEDPNFDGWVGVEVEGTGKPFAHEDDPDAARTIASFFRQSDNGDGPSPARKSDPSVG